MESSLGMRDDKQRITVIDIESGESEEPQGQMTKTRSYGDLMHAPDHAVYLHRRRSDPSISMEKYVISMIQFGPISEHICKFFLYIFLSQEI